MRTIILSIIMSIVSGMPGLAQTETKNDVILKMNGEEMVGKVKEISDAEITFVYSGEDLVYKVKKQDILKITFASGRVEIFNKQSQPSANQAAGSASKGAPGNGSPGLEEHHNKVAILPFVFLKEDQISVDEMGLKVQSECFTILNQHAGVLTIVDPRTTNAKLVKAGITKETIKGFTMEDICNVLGVEFVVEGMVVENKGTQTSYSSGTMKTTSSTNNKNNSGSYSTYGSSSSSTSQAFENTVIIGIYNDKGNSLYSQERKSLLNIHEAYKLTLQYLLKRCPLYSK